MLVMTFIKSLNITKGSFTVQRSKVDHGLRDMKTLPPCDFFHPLNGSFPAFVGRPLERDGFWMMAVRLCEVKMWSEKKGQKRTPVCDLPGDFTKLTSYRAVSIEANVFVSGSHGVNAILEEPGSQLLALCGEVVLVDSAVACACVCVYTFSCVLILGCRSVCIHLFLCRN